MIEYTVKVYDSGDKYWYFNGEIHREDGPAVERSNGDKEWYKNGVRHREDGPAIEYANGSKEWYKNGKRLIVIDGKEIKISEESFNELKKSLN